MERKSNKRVPLKSIRSAHQAEERDWRKAERQRKAEDRYPEDKKAENRKAKREKELQAQDKELPNFLRCKPQRAWARLIGSGIINGFLDSCCDTGCPTCFHIGWKRVKPGTIIDISPPLYTTVSYGRLRDLSYRIVCRHCDEGLITSFRIPFSSQRYIIDLVDVKET